MKALVIVDMQNDFLPGGALGVAGGNEMIPLINQLEEQFSFIVATKDWHPPGHISFASTHGKKPGEIIEVNGIRQVLWPDHCIQNSPGAEFPPSLRTDKIQKIFFKGADPKVDSYSTFFDNAHAKSTGMADFLLHQGVDEVFVVGLTIEYCIKYSVLDARKLGFKMNVILDACKGINLNPGDVDHAIEEIKASGAQIVMSNQLLRNRATIK